MQFISIYFIFEFVDVSLFYFALEDLYSTTHPFVHVISIILIVAMKFSSSEYI